MPGTDVIERLRAGESIDVSIYGNGLRSTKEATMWDDDVIQITHWIDGTHTYFSPTGFLAALAGHQSLWDGDAREADIPNLDAVA